MILSQALCHSYILTLCSLAPSSGPWRQRMSVTPHRRCASHSKADGTNIAPHQDPARGGAPCAPIKQHEAEATHHTKALGGSPRNHMKAPHASMGSGGDHAGSLACCSSKAWTREMAETFLFLRPIVKSAVTEVDSKRPRTDSLFVLAFSGRASPSPRRGNPSKQQAPTKPEITQDLACRVQT